PSSGVTASLMVLAMLFSRSMLGFRSFPAGNRAKGAEGAIQLFASVQCGDTQQPAVRNLVADVETADDVVFQQAVVQFRRGQRRLHDEFLEEGAVVLDREAGQLADLIG